MSKQRSLSAGDVLPASWIASLQEFISTLDGNVNLTKASTTSVQQVAGTGSAQVALGIGGLWRFNSATTTASMPGGATTGSYDVYAIASANVFTDVPSPDTDSTDYTFGLKIVTGGGAAPTGTYNSHTIAATRKIATLDYDGSLGILRVLPLVGIAQTGTASVLSQAIGDGATTSFNVVHNFNTRDVVVGIRQTLTPFAEVIADVQHTSVNQLTIVFGTAPASSAYTVTVIGVK